MLFLCLATIVPLALSDWSEPTPEFTFARLAVTNNSRWIQHWPDYFPDQPPWKHDYPESDEFGIVHIHKLAGIRFGPDSYKIVQLSDDEIFEYPFLY